MASVGTADRSPAPAEGSEAAGSTPSRFLGHGAVLALPGAALLFVLAWWGIGREAWFDEALSIASTSQLWETYDRTAYTMATYYAQLTVWVQPTLDLRWVRLLSVLHAVAAVMVLGVLAVRCFGRRVALWACVLAGASFMVVRYAHEARSFAFLVLLVTLGWLATDHLVEDPSHRGWLACHLFVGVAAPFTHGMAVFALAWQAAALLVAGAGRRAWYATVPGWGLAVLSTGYLYRIGGSDLGTPAVENHIGFVGDFLRAFHGGPSGEVARLELWFLVMAVSLYGTLVCLARLRSASRGLERFRAAMAPAWGMGGVIGILVVNQIRPGVHVRYAIAAAPGLALLWALASEHVASWLKARRSPLRLLGRAPLGALMVLAVLLNGQVNYHDGVGTRWTRAISTIADEAEPGDGVAVPGPHRPLVDVTWRRLDNPPEVASVGMTHPLGGNRRFGWVDAGDIRWQVLFAQRLWVVERVTDRGTQFQDFVDLFVQPAGLTEIDTWEFGSIRLHLYENPRDVSGILEERIGD